MRRRAFIAGLGSAAVWPLAAPGQQRVAPVIGWLSLTPQSISEPFRQGMKDMGFDEGRNFSVEYRYGPRQRQQALAAELVLRRVAVIVANTGDSALGAKAATQTIPVVFGMGGDPVEYGLVASFNRPGGNLTGVAVQSAEIVGKRLDLLHKLVPAAKTIAMLEGPADGPYIQAETRDIEAAGRALGVRVLVLHVTSAEIVPAFAALVGQRADAILVGAVVGLNTPAARNQIIALAARDAIPTMFFSKDAVADGGLASYGSVTDELRRIVGVYTGRILKGEKPSDLPVVQPTKFEFAINLRTARTLGIEIPPLVLAIADTVIE
jgi:putative tryptophan/tyrosine transport system substrate-binding protein